MPGGFQGYRGTYVVFGNLRRRAHPVPAATSSPARWSVSTGISSKQFQGGNLELQRQLVRRQAFQQTALQVALRREAERAGMTP